MSRTLNTSPLPVQARHLPAWSVVGAHSGIGPHDCNIRSTPAGTHRHWLRSDDCALVVDFYGGACGGSRHRQHMYANQAEHRDRSRVQALLASARKIANAGADAYDDIDVPPAPRCINRDLH